jgi:hypothetical protein
LKAETPVAGKTTTVQTTIKTFGGSGQTETMVITVIPSQAQQQFQQQISVGIPVS